MKKVKIKKEKKWQEKTSQQIKIGEYKSLAQQQEFVESLYHKLQLKELGQWKEVPRVLFENGGKPLLTPYHTNNMAISSLFQTLYPNYPWSSNKKKITHNFSTLDLQREFIEKLFDSLELNHLEEWLSVVPKRIVRKGGKRLLAMYNNSLPSLLQALYPHYPWLSLPSFTSYSPKKSTSKFRKIEYQRRLMGKLERKLGITNPDDWLSLPRKQFIKEGGKTILSHYHNHFHKLLSSIYPNHPFKFSSFPSSSRTYFKENENQLEYLEDLFHKLSLTSLEDWKKISVRTLIDHKGKGLISTLYHNDMKLLLTSLYPHYPWSFPPSSSKTDSNKYFSSIDHQREFMDQLYSKLNLSSFDDWIDVTRNKMIENGGKSLVNYYYNGDVKELLKGVYPHYPWCFDPIYLLLSQPSSSDPSLFTSIDNQRKYMQYLFDKLQLKSLDDWVNVTKRKIKDHGGAPLLLLYSSDLSLLLFSLYPSHSWNFSLYKIDSNKYFSSIDHQREFMDQLYSKLNLSSFDDWIDVTRNKIIENGGKSLVIHYYKNDLKQLFTSIYPHYPWRDENIKANSHEYFKSKENQKEFMERLFVKLKLRSLNDWLRVPIYKITNEGGKSLLNYYYSSDLSHLLSSLYPSHPWNFLRLKVNSYKYFSSIDHQREFMDQLYSKLNLSSFDDWLYITRHKMIENGGKSLVIHYENDLKQLFTSIYPHYPWRDDDQQTMGMRKQRRMMEEMFEKLGLKELDDWVTVSRMKFFRVGGRRLAEYYNYDMKSLLQSVYPHQQWKFSNLKFRPFTHYYKSLSFSLIKLKELKEKFDIEQKRDWYRLPLNPDWQINLYHSLKLIYPNERWARSLFEFRSKKTNQRILYVHIKKIYTRHRVFENYRHPQLFFSDMPIELDIFIPAVNLALEYQGEQHFDDMPAGFSNNEHSLSRDSEKEILSTLHSISVVHIPFWWDRSLPSLLSSLPLL